MGRKMRKGESWGIVKKGHIVKFHSPVKVPSVIGTFTSGKGTYYGIALETKDVKGKTKVEVFSEIGIRHVSADKIHNSFPMKRLSGASTAGYDKSFLDIIRQLRKEMKRQRIRVTPKFDWRRDVDMGDGKHARVTLSKTQIGRIGLENYYISKDPILKGLDGIRSKELAVERSGTNVTKMTLGDSNAITGVHNKLWEGVLRPQSARTGNFIIKLSKSSAPQITTKAEEKRRAEWRKERKKRGRKKKPIV